MAAPRYGFGAHQSDRRSCRKHFHFIHDFVELRSQHEIRIGAERGDSPSGIERVRDRLAKAAEIAAPTVSERFGRERSAERFPIELRAMARCRPTAYVHDEIDGVRFQQ